jgi:hypothetical protein
MLRAFQNTFQKPLGANLGHKNLGHKKTLRSGVGGKNNILDPMT